MAGDARERARREADARTDVAAESGPRIVHLERGARGGEVLLQGQDTHPLQQLLLAAVPPVEAPDAYSGLLRHGRDRRVVSLLGKDLAGGGENPVIVPGRFCLPAPKRSTLGHATDSIGARGSVRYVNRNDTFR